MGKIVKSLIVVVVALFLVTIGIDAADHYDNFSESLVGRITGSKPKGPCLPNMMFIATDKGGFCVDEYEASPGENCPNADPASQEDTRMNLNYKECKSASEAGKKPWRNISQNQAMMACAKAGKRLPTSREWFQASLGTPDLDANWQADDCNVKKNWTDNPGNTGSAKNCVSASGVYDMIGNVWEWVDGSIVDGKFSEAELPESGFIAGVDADFMPVKTDKDKGDPNYYNDFFWIKKNGVRNIARGGYWDNGADAGQYALYAVPDVSFAGPGIGFRCVK